MNKEKLLAYMRSPENLGDRVKPFKLDILYNFPFVPCILSKGRNKGEKQ